MTERIWMRFGLVSPPGLGIRQVVEFGDWSTGPCPSLEKIAMFAHVPMSVDVPYRLSRVIPVGSECRRTNGVQAVYNTVCIYRPIEPAARYRQVD